MLLSEWKLKLDDLVSAGLSKIAATAERATSFMDKTASAIHKFAGAGKKAKFTIGELEQKIKDLETHKIDLVDEHEIAKTNGEIQKFSRSLDRLKNLPPDGFFGRMKRLLSLQNPLVQMAAAAFSIREVLAFGKSVVDTTAKYERFAAVLSNNIGPAKAKQAMQDIVQFASQTPFQVDELTESYNKLANRGLAPTMNKMRAMGDLAASQGKSFDQLTEAILDATTGEFERLKEFGIKASANGNKVQLSFKGVTKEVANNQDAIEAALLAYGKMNGVAGAMQKISETTGGKISNLQDKFDLLKLKIGMVAKDALGQSLGMINSLLTHLQQATAWILKHISLVSTILKAVGIVAVSAAIGMAFFSISAKIADVGVKGLARSLFRLNLTMLASPLFWIPAVIGIVAGAIYLLWQRCGAFRGAVMAVWQTVKTAFQEIWNIIKFAVDLIVAYWKFMFSVFSGIVDFIWQKVKGVFTAIWNFIKTISIKIWQAIVAYYTAIWNIIKWVFNHIVMAVKSVWNAFEGFRKFLYNIWNSVKEVFGNIWSFISDVLSKVAGKLLKLGGKIMAKLGIDTSGLEQLSKDVQGIRTTLESAPDKISQAYEKGAKAITDKKAEEKKQSGQSLMDRLIGSSSGGDNSISNNNSEGLSTSMFRSSSGSNGGNFGGGGSSGSGGQKVVNIYFPHGLVNQIINNGAEESFESIESKMLGLLVRVLNGAEQILANG